MKTFKKVLTSIVTMAMMIGCFSVGNLLATVKDPNEPNNTYDKATTLKEGEIVVGEIGDYEAYKKNGKEEEDWFKFSVTKGKTYVLAFTGFSQKFRKEKKSTTLLIDGFRSKANAEKHAIDDFITWNRDGDTYTIKANYTGTYYVRVYNFCNHPDLDNTLETTSYTISVNGLYKDVKKTTDFWYEPTYYLSGLGVVKGYDKGTKFKPDNDCTRAQMVTFLWRLNGSPKPKSKKVSFTDIKSGEYYYNAVLWAVEKGITTDAKKFNPGGVCTRGMTVTFLWRMAGKPSVGKAKCKFSDVKKSDYFYEAVIWASSKKIVAGYSDGTFKPAGKCARRQMVTFLYKYDKYINGRG